MLRFRLVALRLYVVFILTENVRNVYKTKILKLIPTGVLGAVCLEIICRAGVQTLKTNYLTMSCSSVVEQVSHKNLVVSPILTGTTLS